MRWPTTSPLHAPDQFTGPARLRGEAEFFHTGGVALGEPGEHPADSRKIHAGMVDTTDLGLVLVQVVGARREITVVPEPERQRATDLVVISLRHRPMD